MGERITANLPSSDFSRTEAFYAKLGFTCVFRDEGWMILARQGLWVEFFSYPDLDPFQSFFSACLRTTDLDALYDECRALGLSANPHDIPRLTAPVVQAPAPRYFALIDPDGTLWRVLDEN